MQVDFYRNCAAKKTDADPGLGAGSRGSKARNLGGKKTKERKRKGKFLGLEIGVWAKFGQLFGMGGKGHIC